MNKYGAKAEETVHLPTPKEMETAIRSREPETFWIYGEAYKCPGCGCELAPYEIFAARIRGLKKPACLGCLIDAVVHVRNDVWPLLEGALAAVERLAEQVPLYSPEIKGREKYRTYQTTAIHKSGVLVWRGALWTDLAELPDGEAVAWLLRLDAETKVRLIGRLLARIRA